MEKININSDGHLVTAEGDVIILSVANIEGESIGMRTIVLGEATEAEVGRILMNTISNVSNSLKERRYDSIEGALDVAVDIAPVFTIVEAETTCDTCEDCSCDEDEADEIELATMIISTYVGEIIEDADFDDTELSIIDFEDGRYSAYLPSNDLMVLLERDQDGDIIVETVCFNFGLIGSIVGIDVKSFNTMEEDEIVGAIASIIAIREFSLSSTDKEEYDECCGKFVD